MLSRDLEMKAGLRATRVVVKNVLDPAGLPTTRKSSSIDDGFYPELQMQGSLNLDNELK
jgi:hypothetical protein